MSLASQPRVTGIRVLVGAAWLAGGVVLVAGRLAARGTLGPAMGVALASSTAAFAVALLAPLLVMAMIRRRQRVALLALAAGVALWAGGSVLLSADSALMGLAFPAPGELLFLAAYPGLAGYLILIAGPTRRAPWDAWLDAAITCGGAASLAGFAVLSPAAAAVHRQQVPLMAALVDPALDVALVLLALGGLVLYRRRLDARAITTLAGLVLLTAADTSMISGYSTGRYGYSGPQYIAWTLAFLLLVSGAVLGSPTAPESGAAGGELLPEPARLTGPDPLRGAVPAGPARLVGTLTGGGGTGRLVTVISAGVALTSLTYLASLAVRPYVVLPAAVTLVAAGLRLISALQQARGAAEASRLSLTDPLTGLPNRRALDAWMCSWVGSGAPLALALLDLDGFKEINDSLGHPAGDVLLRTVAVRLGRVLGQHAQVARLGGDEFALLIRDDDPERLLDIAERLRQTVRKPSRVDGIDLSVDASIGVAVWRQDSVWQPEGTCGSDLLRQADVAMYQAKARGGGAQLYDPGRDEYSRERLQITEELRRGIAAGQLEVWYQPQVNAITRTPCSVEALVRWRHPVRGVLLPAAFLPAARRARLMPALTEVVLDQIIVDAQRWFGDGLMLRIAVNVAPAELLAGSVLPRLFRLLSTASLAAGSLVIEVTEDSFLADPPRARQVIHDIREHGLEVSVDDYGTGFSSLSYLRDLPLHELKIDRSFVAAMPHDRSSRLIVTTTNHLAHGLGLRTVAEGVEDESTARVLEELGVDILQGYLFGRPMPAFKIPDWMREQAIRAPVR